jgi:hypothetical protein
MDCHTSAKREYETVLRQDSQNAEAQRKLAQLQSWRGKHQDARRRLIGYLRTHPNDGLDRFEGMLLLAQAEKELGLTDQARATTSDLLARLPPDRLAWLRKDALQLMDEMENRRRPGGGLAFQSSEQSDDLSISVASLQQDLTLNGGRTTVGPRYQRWDYEPERGPTPVVVQRPGVYARHRISDRSELTSTVFVDRIEPERGAQERTVLTYDTYLTLRPTDLLRFYIGSNRTTFDNVKSLLQGISATQASVSMDVVPDQRTGLAARFNWSDYTDGNRHRWAQFEVKRQVWRRRNLFLGARYTTVDFAKQLDNGYFNPKSYRSLVATLNVWGHSGDRFYYNLEGAYGRENAEPDGAKPFSSGGVRLTYKLGERMDLEAGWSFFSTKQESSGGFARRTASVSFRYGL